MLASATLSLYCQLAGLDPATLSDTDRLAFHDLLNSWLRRGWHFYPWPQLLKLEQTTVSPDGFLQPPPPAATWGSIISVHTRQPEPSTRSPGIHFTLTSSGPYVGKNRASATLWAWHLPPCPTISPDSPSAEIPDHLATFAAHGAYTDFLRSEGQTQKALAETRDPWDWLYDEIDSLARLQSQPRLYQFRR